MVNSQEIQPGMKREFLGVWIPREIYLDEHLSWTEKILLIEITSLDTDERGCFASNEYLAGFLKIKNKLYVSQMISKLKDLGYVWEEKFDGRRRTLHSKFKSGSDGKEVRKKAGKRSKMLVTVKSRKESTSKTEQKSTSEIKSKIDDTPVCVETVLKEANNKEEDKKDVLKGISKKTPSNNLVKYFKEKFKTEMGISYTVSFGKDTRLLEKMLLGHTEEEVITLINQFFISDNNFIKSSGYTIGVFYSVINRLKVETSKQHRTVSTVEQGYGRLSAEYLKENPGLKGRIDEIRRERSAVML